MQTWGVTKRLDSDGETVKGFDMSMRFDPSERNSHKKFKQMCVDIQTKLIDDAFEHSQKWFGKKAKLRDVVEDKFNTLLKYPRKKDNSGELDLSREPTLRPKFRFWDGAFTGSKLFKLADDLLILILCMNTVLKNWEIILRNWFQCIRKYVLLLHFRNYGL